MQILGPTPRSSSSSTSAQLLNLALLNLLLLVSISVASQPGDQSTSKKILKRVLVKKSKSAGSSNFAPKKPFERSQMLETQDDHVESREQHLNSIPTSYTAPAAYPHTNLSWAYLPPSMASLGKEEAMAAMLMSMADNLTPASVQYDPYLMHDSRSQMLEHQDDHVQSREHHLNSIPNYYIAPAAYPPTNVSSAYLPPSMMPFGEEEAMATLLMSMADNLTPPSVHYDPYLMHGGGLGATMMSMPPAAQEPEIRNPKTLGLLRGSKITLSANIKMNTPIPFCQFDNSPCKEACPLSFRLRLP